MPYNEQDRPFIPSMSWVACLPAGAMLYQHNILYRRVKGSKLSSSGVAIYRYPEALAMQTVYKPSLSLSLSLSPLENLCGYLWEWGMICHQRGLINWPSYANLHEMEGQWMNLLSFASVLCVYYYIVRMCNLIHSCPLWPPLHVILWCPR